MTSLVIPSTQVAFIQWAKGNANIAAQVGTRVSSSMPIRGAQFPWVEVRRITGAPNIEEAPIDFARLQLNVWGNVLDSGLPDWLSADLPARVIEAEVRHFRGQTVGDAYIAEMTTFEGMQQLEDPETKNARFWMDVLCIVRRSDGQ